MISKKRIEELALFLDIDEKEIVEKDRAIQHLPGYAKWVNVAVTDWESREIDQNKRREIEDWFRENDKYIFELSDVHSRRAKQRIVRLVINILQKEGSRTLLDFGGGIGEEAIQAAKVGIRASLADLPSKTQEFAKWRAKHHGVKLEFIEVVGSKPLKKSYDAIFCFEVLQHLFDAEVMARHLVVYLNKGGLLLVTTRFNNPGYSMALEKNQHYDEGMVKFFSSEGLRLVEKIYQYGEGKRKKYLYVYRKK